jgi:hypothetical protein
MILSLAVFGSFGMLQKTFIPCILAFSVSAVACFSAPESSSSARLQEMKKSIQAAYQAQDLQKAAGVFEQMIPIMKKEYGERDVAVGQTLRNYAYLLSSLNRKQESVTTADEASKILFAGGTDVTVGNSKLGRYRMRCPANYESKCRGGVGDDGSWVSSYEFFDTPARAGQMYTWRVEVFEWSSERAGHFRYGNLKDYLSGCFADQEVLLRPKPVVIDGITFDRGVTRTITPGDYRADPSEQNGAIYFGRSGNTVIIMQCRSPVGGFPVTLALVEPAFRTFRKLK